MECTRVQRDVEPCLQGCAVLISRVTIRQGREGRTLTFAMISSLLAFVSPL